MFDWVPGYLLTNVNTHEVIENEHYALVGSNDPRVMPLRRMHNEFNALVTSFTDEFGTKLTPAILMIRAGSGPEVLDLEAVSGFRDAIALSFLCKSIALRTVHQTSHGISFSSSFDFYPWITSVDYSAIIAMTPALTGFHLTRTFRGQCTPGLPHANLRKVDADEPLLNALLGEWTRRFITHRDAWRGIALFRSLEMACAASKIPSGPDMTHYALGRAVGLWISAFEILVHSGDGDINGYKNVYQTLNQIDWRSEDCKQHIHQSYAGRNKTALNSLPCWIYGELFRARNDFLHGSPVKLDRLVVPTSNRTLYNFAAPLYRMCLAAFLGLNAYGPSFRITDVERASYSINLSIEMHQEQDCFERALQRVLKPINVT